ncbi:MAG: aminomethyl transferase family protein [Phycisphaeraceae bacterium]|nr:aminomethyl transferase family protein [Phycisphaeraceae bacterium]
MTKTDPLRKRLIEAEASWLLYGQGADAVELVASFGSVELEYASLRKGCVVLDQPHRATLRMTGADRRSLMNSLFTQELKDLAPGQCRRSLWLNRQGRIDADLRIVELEGESFLDVDRNAADRALGTISSYIITEDAALENATDAWRRLALHGPRAAALLTAISGVEALDPGAVIETTIGGVRTIVDRQDSLGVPGYELLVQSDGAGDFMDRIEEAGSADESLRWRRSGWLACNTARIESGWPLYLTDFGTDSIPNELGELLGDRVSFTKGCYLGQEVVARIHAQGQPKRLLVAVRMAREVVEEPVSDALYPDQANSPEGTRARTLQPETGTPLFDKPGGTIIGAVTSATLSPMLGDAPIALAQIKTSAAKAGLAVHADLGSRTLQGEIQERLRFV